MKKVFLDTNVLLDIFLKRKPFYINSSEVFKKIEKKKIRGGICALSFTTIFYILEKEASREKAFHVLKKIRTVLKVAPVDEKTIDSALESTFQDFEDAVQYYSALKFRSDCIITRNTDDFKESEIPVLTPEEFLQRYSV